MIRNCVFILFVFGLMGCSAIFPSYEIESMDAVGTYPAVGVTPTAPAPVLTPAERDRLFRELNAARDGNSKAASTPLTQPVR